MATTKTKATVKAMRPSVRRTTASSQTTTGTTRATSSSQCTTSTPMTTLTPTIAWCTSCVELAHSAHCFTLDDDTAHLMAQVLSNHIVISTPYMARSLWLDLSLLPLLFLPVFLRLLPLPELFLELDNPIVMARLRYSAADESEDTLNSFTSHTLREALHADLQQNNVDNPFSNNSKEMIRELGNVELFELCETIPKVQCSHCLLYWKQGTVYCICGQSWLTANPEE